VLDDWAKMGKLLEENRIDYTYKTPKKNMEDFINFRIDLGVRTKMIALFAFMETVFCLITIYNSKLSDE
jgi:hypothetical protein